MRAGKISALFFHFSVFDLCSEFFKGGEMEIDRAFANFASACSGNDDVFIRASEERADHQNGNSIRSRKSLRNIRGFQFFCNDLKNALRAIPLHLRSDFST